MIATSYRWTVVVSAAAAVGAGSVPSQASAGGWSPPVRVAGEFDGDGDGEGTSTVVGVSADGRGTIGWNGYRRGWPVARFRAFSPTGLHGPRGEVPRGGVTRLVRDDAGHPLALGDEFIRNRNLTSWTAAPSATGRWRQRKLPTTPQALVGLPLGFALAGRRWPNGGRVNEAFTFRSVGVDGRAAAPIGPGLPNASLAAPGLDDDSSAARSATGQILMLGSTASHPISHRDNLDGKKTALLRISATPGSLPIPGTPGLEEGAISAAGAQVAIAGIDGAEGALATRRGRPVVVLGTEDALSSPVAMPGASLTGAYEVDVAARSEGGAFVTWLQEASVTPSFEEDGGEYAGDAHWASVAADGQIEGRGVLWAKGTARDLRVETIGGSAVAVWTGGPAARGRLHSALITGAAAAPLAAPKGRPLGWGGRMTTRLSASGGHAALSFFDNSDGTVRLSMLTLD